MLTQSFLLDCHAANEQITLYLFHMVSKLTADSMSSYISQYWPPKSLSISVKPADLFRGEKKEGWQNRNRGYTAGTQQTPETFASQQVRNPSMLPGCVCRSSKVSEGEGISVWILQMWSLYSSSGLRENHRDRALTSLHAKWFQWIS